MEALRWHFASTADRWVDGADVSLRRAFHCDGIQITGPHSP